MFFLIYLAVPALVLLHALVFMPRNTYLSTGEREFAADADSKSPQDRSSPTISEDYEPVNPEGESLLPPSDSEIPSPPPKATDDECGAAAPALTSPRRLPVHQRLVNLSVKAKMKSPEFM
jgi:hypothetical protein